MLSAVSILGLSELAGRVLWSVPVRDWVYMKGDIGQ